MANLAVEGLCVSYGPIKAVRALDLSVRDGEVVALLGPNGAGKSSTMQALMGLLRPAEGRVELDGRDITAASPESIVRRGMTLVPEGRRVFGDLTVAENLRLGGATSRGSRWAAEFVTLFPILTERRDQKAGTLSGGEQQQLAIARALMSDPQILLLDEPSLGLAPKIVTDIFNLITALREAGLTILLVEQNVHRALSVCDRALVMSTGQVVASGSPAQLIDSGDLAATYFGTTKGATR